MTQTAAPRFIHHKLGFHAAFFSITLFSSAALMFAIQPMVGKMMLPMVGGTPSAWLVAMAFFQLALLAGYGFAHLLTFLPPRRHVMTVCGVLVAGLILLPFDFSDITGAATPGSADVFWTLVTHVFLPFFALSTVSSSLQRLFSTSFGPSADPYFLFAASNFGSFCGLLLYPFWLERNFGLLTQSYGWLIGYLGLIALCIACLVLAGKSATNTQVVRTHEALGPLSWVQRGRWVLLSFLPSSLMLGVTSYITVEQGSIPLFWVIPLALYLLTFVIAFASRQIIKPSWVNILHPFTLTIIFFVFLERPFIHGMTLEHLHYPVLAFFLSALLCHLMLSAERPQPGRLTEYYLWIAVGGALGGSFNAFLAPLLFSLPIEFMLVALVTCWIHPGLFKSSTPAARRVRIIAVVLAVVAAFMWSEFGPNNPRYRNMPIFADTMPLKFALAGIFCYLLFYWFLATNSERFKPKLKRGIFIGGLALLAVIVVIAVNEQKDYNSVIGSWNLLILFLAMVIVSLWPRWFMLMAPTLALMAFFIQAAPELVDVKRNFFGVWRVFEAPINKEITARMLFHGSTMHDAQQIAPTVNTTPSVYFDPTAALGDVFSVVAPADVGIIGLGAGSMACYQKPGQLFTFYEIDPDVVEIAKNEFDYMKTCGMSKVELGDGRRALLANTDARYDMFVIDAFTSDMIPVHMLTKEAFQLYLDRLKPGGVLVVHISSRYYDLRPPLAKAAREMGLFGMYKVSHPATDLPSSMVQANPLTYTSMWAVLLRTPEKVPLFRQLKWLDLPESSERLWTDDYSTVLPILNYNQIF